MRLGLAGQTFSKNSALPGSIPRRHVSQKKTSNPPRSASNLILWMLPLHGSHTNTVMKMRFNLICTEAVDTNADGRKHQIEFGGMRLGLASQAFSQNPTLPSFDSQRSRFSTLDI